MHRLLQRVDWDSELNDERLRQKAASILSTVAAVQLEHSKGVVEEAVAQFLQISSRADIRELYRSGRAYYEVPFTMQATGQIVRGTIDCLIAADDRVTVLEFKTGRRRSEHSAQTEVYRAAAQALFPGLPVDSRLVYTSESAGA